MPDLLNVEYACDGSSTKQNPFGMREMQARAYEKRDSQYLLLKAPPASGKSRALMFLALDKIYRQGLEKALVAVPEMSIGASFQDTDLTSGGFFADWRVEPEWNLCTPDFDEGKVGKVLAFLEDRTAHFLVCTHATLRFAWAKIAEGHPKGVHAFDKTVIAIDEFHHASTDDGNKLGAMLADVMEHSSAHVVAMTGSYFRGDAVPILKPEVESHFNQVTYTYYEQLNGYRYLKSLGLGYHFYQGQYFDALGLVLDSTKKTIVHIPNVNSSASTGFKKGEVAQILDILGFIEKKDPRTGIMTVRTKDGRRLKVADLVSDDPMRVNVLTYLRNVRKREDMDVIIALNMAKEGFDWPWCEHVLTIGYRSSLTEVVQIIGRATRDCEGKSHAQFTNLIAQPDAEDKDVRNSVNDLLKAIALSLLMREVLAPNITFRPKSTIKSGEKPEKNVVVIDDTEHPVSPKVAKLLKNGAPGRIVQELLVQTKGIAPAVVGGNPSQTTEVELPKIVMKLYPKLDPVERDTLAQVAKARLVVSEIQGGRLSIRKGKDGRLQLVPSSGDGGKGGSAELLNVGRKLLDIDSIDMDLIDKVNPFQGAYEILSKSFDAPTLKTIQDAVSSRDSVMSEEEAVMLWPDVVEFAKAHGREPLASSAEPFERRLAEALAFVRNRKAKQLSGEQEAKHEAEA